MLQQFILNSLIASYIYFLMALGFTVIYRTVRFFHFAHAIVFTTGAYFTFLFSRWLGLPLWISIIFAIAASTVLGCLMEFLIYRPLRNRGSSGLVLLLASLGMYILLQNVVSMAFGDETRSIRTGPVQEGINILGARITPIQIVTIVVSISLAVGLWLFLRVTRIGKSMRAVANDPELANISGIHSNRIILWAFTVGSALAGLAGILVALDVDMTPTMGMNALMMGVVVVIIGGVSSIPGIAAGALLLALAQHLGAWYIGSEWQEAIAFVVLVLFLVIRPEGFMGRKIKSATV